MARAERLRPQSAINLKGRDLAYAVGMVETICWLAGTPNYLDDVREAVAEFFEPSELKQSRRLFEWLATQMSFQGISDEVARNYMDTHGRASWSAIARSLKAGPECALLDHYWSFADCRFQKSAATCSHPQLLHACPLPTFTFRNGRMNQLAYSLFLFIRDVAGGNLVGWIDDKLSDADRHTPTNLAESVIAPMRGIFGVSDKVLNMVMSSLLIAGTERNPLWGIAGGSMIAVDTLVHNFLHRTGILRRADALHPYGERCYGPQGCEAVIKAISAQIDARQFKPHFPRSFPRYVQRCLWLYCAREGLDVCNGTMIDDAKRCRHIECRLFDGCDRVRLRS